MRTTPSVKDFRGRHVLVVGLGLHGGAASAIRWLCLQGAKVTVTDKKTAAELAPTTQSLKKLPIIYHLGEHHRPDFLRADVIYQNQGVPKDLPELRAAKARGIPIINETTIFFEQCPAEIIGVTGTRGKSTVTALLGAILKADQPRAFVAGNIPRQTMLDLLPKLRAGDRVVLELSSFQLEFLTQLKRSPHVAVMTNLLVDHLNRYGSLKAYAAAKYNIFRWQKINDWAVLNYDSTWVRRAAKLTKAKIFWQGHRKIPPAPGVAVDRGQLFELTAGHRQRLFHVSEWPLPGQHQLVNLLAAVAAARALEIPSSTIRRVVKNFTGLPHRQEVVCTWRGHRFINDTSATTPDGTLAAMQVFPKGLFILGGTDKRLIFDSLVSQLVSGNIPTVFLPGTATEKMIKFLRQKKYGQPIHRAASMAEAIHLAIAKTKPRQPIVLSPGAASFGLFRHEFDRGEQFVRIVRKLR